MDEEPLLGHVVCTRLGMEPDVLRRRVETYGDYLDADPDEGAEIRFSLDDVKRLRAIETWLEEGQSEDDILEQLSRSDGELDDPSPASDQDELTPDEVDLYTIYQYMRKLDQRLDAVEERTWEVQDKSHMALIKLKQEIKHLRYELTGLKSRRERKAREGFWRRFRDGGTRS